MKFRQQDGHRFIPDSNEWINCDGAIRAPYANGNADSFYNVFRYASHQYVTLAGFALPAVGREP